MSCSWSRILVVILGAATPALAAEETPAKENSPNTPSEGESTAAPPSPRDFDAPHIDYPPLQGLRAPASIYVDHTYESTSDLSTFWWVRGRGANYRMAVGGLYQLGGLRLNAEVPVQYTQLHIDSLMGQPPTDADRSKAVLSLGDIITGAAYSWDLPIEAAKTYLGPSLRVRLPTHTTQYRFGLIDGSTMAFGFPYYLHLAPSVLFSTRLGPLALTLSEGALAMLAKDINLGGIPQQIPNLYFWESHLAADIAATDWLHFSVEFLSCLQLGQTYVSNMPELNGIKAHFINPGMTLDFGGYRLVVAGRFGLPGHSTRDFGVITFSGSHALLARLSYVF